MAIGWIKIHRKMKEWEWYSDINTFRLFMHVLLSAEYTQKKIKGIVVERGQMLTSLSALSEETGLSVKQIRLCLNRLKTTNEVATRTTNKYTLLSIVNYGKYQIKDESGASKKTNSETIKGQTKGKQTHATKNYIIQEDNKYNNNIIYTQFSTAQTELSFDDFWNEYHRVTKKPKTDKEPAQKKWAKLTKEEQQKAYDKAAEYSLTSTDPQFLKKARTYLENKTFNDEFQPAQKQAVSHKAAALERNHGKRIDIEGEI